MAGARVRLVDRDDGFALARRLSVSAGPAGISTPIRALYLKPSAASESRIVQDGAVRGLNEVCHALTRRRIEDIDGDAEKLLGWGRRLGSLLALPGVRDELNLLYYSYENGDVKAGIPNTPPTGWETDYLCNIVCHPASPVVIPPTIPNVSGAVYLGFLRRFFDSLKSYRKNPLVMGNIPVVATRELREINRFYLENGVNMFSVNFNGKYPIDSYLAVNEVRRMTSFIEKEHGGDCYLHAFNVPQPGPRSPAGAAPAGDMMALASGFDSFGAPHAGGARPGRAEKIGQKGGPGAGRGGTGHAGTPWLFNRGDYGYYGGGHPGFGAMFGDDGRTVRLSEMTGCECGGDRSRGLQKAFNAEGQALEALEYRTLIGENKTAGYLEGKAHVRGILGRIRDLMR